MVSTPSRWSTVASWRSTTSRRSTGRPRPFPRLTRATTTLVEEPTDAELAELTRGSDATAKAGAEPDEDGDGELVGVGAARASTAKTSERGKTADPETDKDRSAKARTEKKGRATAKRDDSAPTHKRTGPVTFVKESVGELRKVVYPTGPQLLNYFVVVLIFVLFIIAVVSVLDLVFGWAILKVFS